ncbi:MAG: HEAT repeat domain-containing protein [Planctomycetes bacterium]|nr:HEAT repeat domain-containing protein [Planctomycetota bacterium]
MIDHTWNGGCHERAKRRHAIVASAHSRRTLLVVSLALATGCATTPTSNPSVSRTELRRGAVQCLFAAIRYRYNPAVRAAAVESLEATASSDAAARIRAALLDEHPAVRFAACVAVGKSQDRLAESAIRRCLEDSDANVRVGALFAMHRLGHTEDTGKLATLLLKHNDPAVRRNAALVTGILVEPGAIKALARAMKDRDKGVRDHALEAMARLHNADAKREMVFMTEAGIGAEEVFALSALAVTRDPALAETFRYKLAHGDHLETRLAAARGLGLLGLDDGYDIANRALSYGGAPVRASEGSRAQRLLRVRLLAASALGAIGRTDALGALDRLMNRSTDPREQVAAARAILEIIEANRKRGFPSFP